MMRKILIIIESEIIHLSAHLNLIILQIVVISNIIKKALFRLL